MIQIVDVENLGLKVNWTTVFLLVRYNLITQTEVVNYAIFEIENGSSRNEVCQLAGTPCNATEDINKLLWKLSECESKNKDVEMRKIRATVVNQALKHKMDNHIDGLIALRELWQKFGYMCDTQQIIQGLNNNIPLAEYYTLENYNDIYQKHIIWLKNEVTYLKDNQ